MQQPATQPAATSGQVPQEALLHSQRAQLTQLITLQQERYPHQLPQPAAPGLVGTQLSLITQRPGAAQTAASTFTGFGCTITGQRLVCRLGNLPDNAVRTLSFAVRATSSGVYVNTATVTATDDVVESNNSDDATVRVTVSAQHPQT
jgi:hypothetical protein